MSRASVTPASRSRAAIGATWPSTRATVSRSRSRCSASSSSRDARSIASLVSTPVLLQVADERRAEVADGLLAGVQRHVLAERVERLLADAHRPPVGDAAD